MGIQTKKIWTSGTMALLGSGYCFLGVEYMLNVFRNQSLCETVACTLASNMLGSFSKEWLLALGALWIGMLGIALLNGSKAWRGIFLATLYGGVAFEGALLGSLLATRTPCTLCLIVGGFVVTLLILFTLRRPSFGFGGFAAWLGAMAASFLLMQGHTTFDKPLDMHSTSIVSIQGSEDSVQGRAMNLFIRFDCSHCESLLTSLSEAHELVGRWNIHLAGQKISELEAKKIMCAQSLERDKGIGCILTAKRSTDLSDYHVSSTYMDSMSKKVRASLDQLRRFDVDRVPTLVVTQPNGKIVITGVVPIMRWMVLNKAIK